MFWSRTDQRVTFMGVLLNMAVGMSCTGGSDQVALQRDLSTRNAQAARQSFALHLVTSVLTAGLLALMGRAV